jgi:hypothetical protein
LYNRTGFLKLKFHEFFIMFYFRYILESGSFELFFEYVELPNFDIASDALNTFKVNPYVHVFCVI